MLPGFWPFLIRELFLKGFGDRLQKWHKSLFFYQIRFYINSIYHKQSCIFLILLSRFHHLFSCWYNIDRFLQGGHRVRRSRLLSHRWDHYPLVEHIWCASWCTPMSVSLSKAGGPFNVGICNTAVQSSSMAWAPRPPTSETIAHSMCPMPCN